MREAAIYGAKNRVVSVALTQTVKPGSDERRDGTLRIRVSTEFRGRVVPSDDGLSVCIECDNPTAIECLIDALQRSLDARALDPRLFNPNRSNRKKGRRK